MFFGWLRRRAAAAVLQGIEDAARQLAEAQADETPALTLRLPLLTPAVETTEGTETVATGRKKKPEAA